MVGFGTIIKFNMKIFKLFNTNKINMFKGCNYAIIII